MLEEQPANLRLVFWKTNSFLCSRSSISLSLSSLSLLSLSSLSLSLSLFAFLFEADRAAELMFDMPGQGCRSQLHSCQELSDVWSSDK